jgi:hypothetical protein
MLTKEDKELLCWIGNRLVYKYGEDEQIVVKLNDIITRDKIFSEVIVGNCQINYNGISSTIKYLIKLNEYSKEQARSIPSLIRYDKINTAIPNFENMDVDLQRMGLS